MDRHLTITEPTAAANHTPSRCAFAQCIRAAPLCDTAKTGPHLSAELIMTHCQPPPVAINSPQMDAIPPATRTGSSVSAGLRPSPCAAAETGSNLPAKLVMITRQPPPFVLNGPLQGPQYRNARRCSCDHSVCTGFCPSCATVEIGPNSPAELAIVSHQPPPVVQQRMDAPPPAYAPRRCSCDCLVCTRFCWSYMSFRQFMSACHTPTVEESTGQNHTTSCQLCPWWMTLPVQESLSGYNGPSALV